MPRLHLLSLIAVMFLFLGGDARAADPVERLRNALKIEPLDDTEPSLQLAAKRNKLIEAVLPELKTVSLLRRAYFLPWPAPLADVKPHKVLDVQRYRREIGDRLGKLMRGHAQGSVEEQLAVAILLGEIGDKESIEARGKVLAQSLTDSARLLAGDKDTTVRQAGLHALGKIAHDPLEAMDVFKDTLAKDEVGPRRLAAYAMIHLLRTARSFPDQRKLAILDEVVAVASLGLRDADEPVRGYSLQAIGAAIRVIGDEYPDGERLTIEIKGKKTLRPQVQKSLRAFQAVNPQILQAVHDARLNVRLAALLTLDQIGNARAKIVATLADVEPDKSLRRAELIKKFDMPDPLDGVLANLGKISDLLQDDDARLRRGAIEFLEFLGDQAEPAVDDVTQALRDNDRAVRRFAARIIRNVAGPKVPAEAVRHLGTMLLDPDPDLSAASASALEALGPAAQDAVDWLAFIIGNGDADRRTFDVENRVAALKALAGIGSPAAQRALPQLVNSLADDDVRIRRQATAVFGQIGRPADPDHRQQVLAALRRALSDDDPVVRLNASEAILTIAPPR